MSPLVRSDLLKICNDQGVPLDQFKMQFCDRCRQPECTRSQSGQTRFEQRVNNWYENLFANPPRMDAQDPRYGTISGQKFLMIDPVIPSVSSDWVDPRDLTDQNTPTVAPTVVKPVTAAPEVPTLSLDRTQLMRLPTLNTPKSGPKMVGNAKAPEPADPWAGAEPLAPNEKVVKPGTKIRFSGVKVPSGDPQ